MVEFVGRMEMAFIATADAGGECDSSLRAGPAGFLHVIDTKHLAYPEYRGNGVMATAGNILFGGTTEGNIFALDAKTGKHLWRFATGGFVISNPITYMAAGKQYVAMTAGDVLIAFGLN